MSIGAAALLLGLLPRFRYTGVVAVAAAAGALLALLLMAVALPARGSLSAWQPASLFGDGLRLEVDALGWLFALGAVATTASALVTGLARPGGRRVGTRISMLLLTAAALISFFSGNLLTRIIAWALLDLIYFLALLFLAEGEGLEPQAVLNLAFNSAGTLAAVGAAVLINRAGPGFSLHEAAQTPQSTLLITLAAVFRLGLFPLHLGLPTDIHIRQGLNSLLRLLPAAVALETITRLAVFGIVEPVRPWLTVFGLAAALVGAAQLWNVGDARQGLPYVIIAQSGVALLGALWAGPHAALTVAATTLALLLGGALVYLANGHDLQHPWISILPLAGAAGLIGVPATVGFVGVGHLYGELMAGGGWAWLVLAGVVVAQALLAAGLLYTVFWLGTPLENRPAVVATYFGGLSLPAILLVVSGVLAGSLSGILGITDVGPLGFSPSQVGGVVLVALTAVAGFLLWRFEGVVRARLAPVGGTALVPLARLDWLYRLVWSVIHALGTLVNNVAGVLEGEGAVLWALVAGAAVWLLLR